MSYFSNLALEEHPPIFNEKHYEYEDGEVEEEEKEEEEEEEEEEIVEVVGESPGKANHKVASNGHTSLNGSSGRASTRGILALANKATVTARARANRSVLVASITRGNSELPRMLGSMTKLFSKNLARSTDLLFLKSLTGSNSAIRQEKVMHELEAPPSYLPVTHDSIRLIEQTKTICEQRVYLDEAKELLALISDKFLQAVLEIHDEVSAQMQNCNEDFEYIDGVSSVDEDDEFGTTRNNNHNNHFLSSSSCSSSSRHHPLEEEEMTKKNKKKDQEEEEEEMEEVKVDTFRVIGVRRIPGECLGLTVRLENNRVIVARILIDSVIDRQGLFKPGDMILQANGKDVKSPEELQRAIEDSASEFIVFKIRPAPPESPTDDVLSSVRPETSGKGKFFVRAMFDYNPSSNNLLPCQDIGLPFLHGDILEVVNWSDPSWWQARKVNSKERPGLVPSQDLEERRQCFVLQNGFATSKQKTCCGTGLRKEKRKYAYHVRKNLDFDKAELILYECVEKMPPFSRKTLVLVSPHGVGKQSLIHRLVDSNTDMFGTTIPLTSRPMGDYEIDGESCWFVTKERMLEGLENNEFLDLGEHDSHLFGTTVESVRSIMNENKLCVLDVRPEALKLLHNSTEFLPYVIYLSPSAPENYKIVMENGGATQNIELADCRAKRLLEESNQIKREFQKYFDLEFVFEDTEETLVKIQGVLKKLMSETQWVPRNWVYS